MNWNNGLSKQRLPQWLDALEEKQRVKRQVTVAELLFENEDSGFAAYACVEDKRTSFRIAGVFPFTLKQDQSYWIEGRVAYYKDTKQIAVDSVYLARPVTTDGIILLLQSLDGLDKRAYTLLEHFGEQVLDIMLENPKRVAEEVSGISERQAEAWSMQLKLLGGNFDLLAKLQGWGLSLNQAKKLIAELGQQVDAQIESNPYMLAKRVRGFGFRRCDAIAQELGFDMRSRSRIVAAIRYVLREASYEGHCFLRRPELVDKVKQTLDLPPSELHSRGISFEKRAIEALLDPLLERGKLIEDAGRVYLSELYYAELKVAASILRLLLHQGIAFPNAESELQAYLQDKGLHLEQKQIEAALQFTEQTGGMYILNGSAGCGKTFTLNIILDLLERQYERMSLPFEVKVFAPTGKAAKVAAKATGRACTTIHRGLKYNPERGFEYNEQSPLPIDCLVLDESSMLDIALAKHLFSAIPPHCKVIFMGDTKQLPSVGAGNVLHDLIASEVIPVVTLDVVKRQGKDSGIVANATRIIQGKTIAPQAAEGDAFVIAQSDAARMQMTMLRSIARLMETKDYSLEDIQVLCPQRKGEAGTYVMNWLIQQAFNDQREGLKVENCKFSKVNDADGEAEQLTLYFMPGDKVIHTANNYAMKWYSRSDTGEYVENADVLGITNGECGIIEEIKLVQSDEEHEEAVVIVRYEDGYVMYTNGLDELDHCYAMTVHKSQGSQWPAVLLVVMQEHYHMLDNSIFYTGYTRAKQFVCVIGQQRAIDYAIGSFKHTARNSSLNEKFLATS